MVGLTEIRKSEINGKKQLISRKTKKRYILIVGIACGVLLIFDTLLVGNIAYYAKWAQCGTQPVILDSPPKIGEGSYPPTYFARTSPSWLRAKAPLLNLGGVTLHCSLNNLSDRCDHLEVCNSDSTFRLVTSLDFDGSCI